ncbi:MAG TPA: HAMP domain-containing sensor histidine kinase, partial [Myxococcales bacterium]|nr:HAMP domain-containing sensor histidine kinase [Myxococcales bacterium]
VAVTLWYWYASGASRTRFAIVCAFLVAAIAYLGVLFWRERRKPIGPNTVATGFIGTIVVTYGACALTGGLDSPFVILIPAVAASGAFGSDRSHAWIVATLLPAGIGLLALIGGSRPLFTVGVLFFGSLVGISVGVTIRRMFERMLVRALQARDDLLRMHSDQLQELTAFSSEIAHELKTPLASIKGLTGLALIELSEPARAAERLEVLRSEALRMQHLLDDFLDFSRPLAPLVLAPDDGLEIADEVIDLFQGLARERQMSMRLYGAPVELLCDAAKLKQILINLVQNAIEASSSGGEITVEVESTPIEARIRVLDRGHGLSGEIGDRVFDAGVTTKPRGSGLGLTIARSIAKQHGGSLTLRPRDGGGCVAELVLPRGIPAESQREQAA